MKEFPIPVVSLPHPGAHQEDETLQYLSMPKDMDTYHPPSLPDPEQAHDLPQALDVLHQVLAHLREHADVKQGLRTPTVSLRGLSSQALEWINQILGEGEASALVAGSGNPTTVQVQEAIFAGVWRIVTEHQGAIIDDVIEVGPVPHLFREIATQDVGSRPSRWMGDLPPNVQNAPMLIEELEDQIAHWRAGQAAHVVNLSLLPVTPEDIAFLDHHLGTGRLVVLSRGYGNCRITNTCRPNCWRVVYYNGADSVILNTVEVVNMPEVALAAPEDLQDSHARLLDVLGYLQSSASH
jgi:hydrogenase-1 operon protein HyaF